MSRAYSARELMTMKRKLLTDLPPEWFDLLGEPEAGGVWFVWGNSGNGKTSFVMQLCKMLTRYGKVLYNSLEEGTALTIARAIERAGLEGSRFALLDCESIEDLSERLSKRRSADIVVVDSLQHAGLGYRAYLRFKRKHKNKLLIFISHAEGKNPKSSAAKSIMYDASLKVWVEGYKAFSKGRYIGPTGEYTIWDKGAARYWGKEENAEEETQE